MSEREEFFRQKINGASGFKRKVLIDLFRQIVLSNYSILNGKKGKVAKAELDKIYPQQGTLPDFEIPPANEKGYKLIDVIILNVEMYPERKDYQLLRHILNWESMIKKGILKHSDKYKNRDIRAWSSEISTEDVEKLEEENIAREDISNYTGKEGRKKLVEHLIRERDRELVKDFKTNRFEQDKWLKCEACDFSFLDTYGKLGERFIEAHHRVQLSTYESEKETPIEALAAVCSNCHRMLHREGLLTIEELKAIIAAQKNQQPTINN